MLPLIVPRARNRPHLRRYNHELIREYERAGGDTGSLEGGSMWIFDRPSADYTDGQTFIDYLGNNHAKNGSVGSISTYRRGNQAGIVNLEGAGNSLRMYGGASAVRPESEASLIFEGYQSQYYTETFQDVFKLGASGASLGLAASGGVANRMYTYFYHASGQFKQFDASTTTPTDATKIGVHIIIDNGGGNSECRFYCFRNGAWEQVGATQTTTKPTETEFYYTGDDLIVMDADRGHCSGVEIWDGDFWDSGASKLLDLNESDITNDAALVEAFTGEIFTVVQASASDTADAAIDADDGYLTFATGDYLTPISAKPGTYTQIWADGTNTLITDSSGGKYTDNVSDAGLTEIDIRSSGYTSDLYLYAELDNVLSSSDRAAVVAAAQALGYSS